MNKLLLSLLCILAICTISYAQKPFQNISFDKALQKAKKENKLIFLQYESDDCIQCNNTANKAFEDEDFANKIASEFVAIKVSPDNRDRIHVGEQYNISEGFGTLFIDGTGKLIYPMRKTFSTPKSYLTEIETAYKRHQDFKTIEEKEKSYFDNNDKNVADLEQLIQAKTDLGINTDLLLTEYINLVPKDSLNTHHTLQFLVKQSPVFNSKAYKAMTSNKNFKEAWHELPAKEKVRTNNEIYRKSIAVAAKNRDESLAKSVARAAMGKSSNQAGRDAHDKYLMSYYSQVKDTAKYFALAIPYYNRYVESLTPSYLAKIDSAAKSNAFKNPEKIISKPMEDGKQLQIRTARYQSPNSTYGNYLFRVANYFNRLDVNHNYIEHSINWARKSVELSEQPNNLHLLAELLYKAGDIEEAIQTEEQAIARSKEYKNERKEWYAVLEKMKAGKPLE